MYKPQPSPTTALPVEMPWAQPVDKVVQTLQVATDNGLSQAEVKRRRKQYGPNLLRAHQKQAWWLILAAQFKSILMVLLAVAAGVSFFFDEIIEGWAIVVVIALNTMIGFFTEWQAVRSMEALYQLDRVRVRVRRAGHVEEINAEGLVPGDVVLIEGGDVITADLRLLEASKLQADESVLTGESLPVAKQVDAVSADTLLAERTSLLFKGTAVTRGAGAGVVVATGMATELGQISALVEGAEDVATPLEKRLEQLGRKLAWATMGVMVLVVLSGILGGKDLLLMVQTGIALAVAAIPEGLPIVATITLARGMRRMARRNALVRRLASVETLGATRIICTDKTGTLTENRMTVTCLALADGDITLQDADEVFWQGEHPVVPDEHPLLRAALETSVLCNDAALTEGNEQEGVGDPLEVALLAAGARAGITRPALLETRPEVHEEAFDSEIKMMATVHRAESGFQVAVKGAPEAVLMASTEVLTPTGPQPLDEATRIDWLQRNDHLARQGLRVLALAMRQVNNPEAPPYENLTFIGLTGLADPPRAEVREAVAKCQEAGIEVIMITGDQPVTARNIAQATGLVDTDEAVVVHGADLCEPASEAEREALLQTRIFARVNPRQKLDLIALHQQAGNIVAMTGDGVNDAPALKKADIGIAMGQRGTQVAREAADMVLRDDAFASIVVAIREGRVIFQNIRKFVYYLMSCNVGEVMIVGLASAVSATLPILPLQILFLNLVTDTFPALALGMGDGDDGVLKQPPRPTKEPILARQHILGIGYYGLAFSVAVLGAFWLAQAWLGMDASQAITVSFLTLAFAQLWHVFNMRGTHGRFFNNEIVRNPYVWGALALCTALLIAAVYHPTLAEVLSIQHPGSLGWLLILAMSLLPLVVGQSVRWLRKGL